MVILLSGTLAVHDDLLPMGEHSAAFAAIAIIDGGHVHPVKNSDCPPCTYGDIDMTGQILQFRRAQAGFSNKWP